MIPEDLIARLRCPQTGQALRRATPAQMAAWARSGRAGHPGNGAFPEQSLLREDGRVVYPVRDGIPVLLADEAIPLPPT